MTGVGGRPEVILEGADSVHGPWLEYEFLYKPGNVSLAPQYMLPHQPRLDWQMWFAALGSYQHNPWLLSLVYRLLGLYIIIFSVSHNDLLCRGKTGGAGPDEPRLSLQQEKPSQVYPRKVVQISF